MTPSPNLVARIMAVMEAAFDPTYGEAWNARQVSDALAMPNTHALLIDGRGRTCGKGGSGFAKAQCAGFVLTRHAGDEEELLLIAVAPQFRQNGLGSTLVSELFDHAKSRGASRVFLEMRRGNPAIRLYNKSGFKPIGKRPNYYRLADGLKIDAITFARDI